MLKWDQVTATPLLSRIQEFKRGTLKGLTVSIPPGLHNSPKSLKGTREESKNNQKIPKKNINSLKIKKNIPNLKPSWTLKVCLPDSPSIKISLNHKRRLKIKIKTDIQLKIWNFRNNTKLEVNNKLLKKSKKGYLERLKIWKLWKILCKILRN